jgi:hypothetical protein
MQQPDTISSWFNRFQADRRRRIASLTRLNRGKGRGLIFDHKEEVVRRNRGAYDDGMPWFITVAMQNYIGQSFFHTQVYGEPGVLAEAILVGPRLDPWLNSAQLREPAVQFNPVLQFVQEHSRFTQGA